jgi:Rrf2 family protein
MLKLSKRTEYAIMAARYLALKNSGNCVTAKEIAEDYQIPYQLVAKVLQNFARTELVSSIQGAKGGYVLNKLPEEISLIDKSTKSSSGETIETKRSFKTL